MSNPEPSKVERAAHNAVLTLVARGAMILLLGIATWNLSETLSTKVNVATLVERSLNTNLEVQSNKVQIQLLWRALARDAD